MKTPAGLSRKAAKLWREVTGTWRLDGDGLATLEVACRSLTRLEAAESIVAEQGMVSIGSAGQPVPHPLLGTIDRERTGYLRAIRQLGLESK